MNRRPIIVTASVVVTAVVAGIDERVGSLERGKDADITVITGDPADPRWRRALQILECRGPDALGEVHATGVSAGHRRLAIIGLGEVALSQGQYSAAITQLKKASKAAPKRARIYTLLGEAYLNSGNAVAAEAASEATISRPRQERAKCVASRMRPCARSLA